MSPHSADVLIVGAGSAGCVLAERLSRDPDRQVLLLERGPSQWPSEQERALHRLPIGVGSAWAHVYPEDSGLAVVRGNAFGGSSAVNGGYFLRWHPEDFGGWPASWRFDEIVDAYGELDGPGGTMNVSSFADDDLAPVVTAFEKYWEQRYPVRAPEEPWPIVGLNRVRSNRLDGLRMTSAEAYLSRALDRPNLHVVGECEVSSLAVTGRAVTGVRVGSSVLEAGEVILCAGTLGTASILLRSGLGTDVGPVLPVWEDREVLVRYRARSDRHVAGALLQSVLHTPDALEIRCYSGDMAGFIDGLPSSGPVIGVAAMRPGVGGEVCVRDDRLQVVLGQLDGADALRLETGAAAVTAMLGSPEFAEFVEPGSVSVDAVVRNSQHAWGSMPMGVRTDDLGLVDGLTGLRIVDGSILPTSGRSGPHATIMMVACRIGDRLIEAGQA